MFLTVHAGVGVINLIIVAFSDLTFGCGWFGYRRHGVHRLGNIEGSLVEVV